MRLLLFALAVLLLPLAASAQTHTVAWQGFPVVDEGPPPTLTFNVSGGSTPYDDRDVFIYINGEDVTVLGKVDFDTGTGEGTYTYGTDLLPGVFGFGVRYDDSCADTEPLYVNEL